MQPSMQWVLSFFPLSIKWLVQEVCHSHPYYASLRLSGAEPVLPCMPSWCGQGQHYRHQAVGVMFSFGGRAPTKQSNAASCMESLSKMNVGWDLTSVLKVVGDRGGTVVKVLCYKLEGRWFDSRWCHWNFSLT